MRLLKTVPSKAAGSGATEAYPQGYVAGRRATKNAAGGPFLVAVMPSSIGCSKWASNKAAGAVPTAGVALGYVEDGDKPRTQLGSIFSILII
jgi:hypothetical protein